MSDPAAKQTILDLRRDPRIAATMAGALTERNREALSGALGREPTGGDLYAAHVLGARGAAALIATAQASPARAAALDMPEAAAANRGLFYDRTGRPRGAAELYAHLATARTRRRRRPRPPPRSALPEGTTAYASLNEGGLRSMFQTDPRQQGGVSAGVARLWQGRGAGPEASRPEPRPRGADLFPALGRHRRACPAAARRHRRTGDRLRTPSRPPRRALVGAPLPPRRPAEFGASGQAARPGAPLDLSLFTIRSGS